VVRKSLKSIHASIIDYNKNGDITKVSSHSENLKKLGWNYSTGNLPAAYLTGLLLGKKAKGRPPYPDVWHTIGGGVEDYSRALSLIKKKKYDDPYLHSELQRELKEEAGISVKNIKNICPRFRKNPRQDIAQKNGKDVLHIFLEYFCELDKGEAVPGSDIVELKWVEKKDLKNVQLTKPSMEMYKELRWM